VSAPSLVPEPGPASTAIDDIGVVMNRFEELKRLTSAK
jgi:hypothetical protein